MADPIHRRPLQVRMVDVDLAGRIRPVVFLDYILESAAEHAALLGVAVTDLFEKNLTWVLSRLHVELLRYPGFGEELEILTWPSGRTSLFALRDFEVRNGSGTAARATSAWLVLDLKSKRPVRPIDRLPPYKLHPVRAIEDGFRPLPAPSNPGLRRVFPVFYSDIDMNRHMTATAYMHRALETVPAQLLFECRPCAIEISYRAEAFYGDAIRSCSEQLKGNDPLRFLHRLSRKSDDKEFALLCTAWTR